MLEGVGGVLEGGGGYWRVLGADGGCWREADGAGGCWRVPPPSISGAPPSL